LHFYIRKLLASPFNLYLFNHFPDGASYAHANFLLSPADKYLEWKSLTVLNTLLFSYEHAIATLLDAYPGEQQAELVKKWNEGHTLKGMAKDLVSKLYI